MTKGNIKMSNVAVPARECGSCNQCCFMYPIEAIQKDHSTWCQHCDIGRGCKIYNDRPNECAKFFCEWVRPTILNLEDEWFPAKSHMIITYNADDNVLYIQTTQKTKSVWRKKPYIDDIMDIANQLPIHVVVRDGWDGWWVKSDGTILNMQEAYDAGIPIPVNR